MNWLDKLERKFGKYAIHNLMYYIIILYILGLVIQMVNPSLYTQWLVSIFDNISSNSSLLYLA